MAEADKSTPPYVAYETFKRFIEHLREIGLPQRIDRSVWASRFSGSSGGEAVAALKFFDLLDEQDHPTQALRDLIHVQGDDQNQVLRDIIERGYAPIWSKLNPANATPALFAEAFRSSFAKLGATPQRKAEAFFRKAAAEVGLLTSPHILQKTRRSPRRNTSQKRTVRTPAAENAVQPEQGDLLSDSARKNANGASPEQKTLQSLQAKYIEMLLNRAEAQETLDNSLLDRIEKLLGLTVPSAGAGEE